MTTERAGLTPRTANGRALLLRYTTRDTTDLRPIEVVIRAIEDEAAALATPDEPVAVDVERLARAHEDIVTMYATHQAGWDVVHDWHSDPGDLFKTRGALKAIVDRADEYDAARLREDVP